MWGKVLYAPVKVCTWHLQCTCQTWHAFGKNVVFTCQVLFPTLCRRAEAEARTRPVSQSLLHVPDPMFPLEWGFFLRGGGHSGTTSNLFQKRKLIWQLGLERFSAYHTVGTGTIDALRYLQSSWESDWKPLPSSRLSCFWLDAVNIPLFVDVHLPMSRMLVLRFPVFRSTLVFLSSEHAADSFTHHSRFRGMSISLYSLFVFPNNVEP